MRVRRNQYEPRLELLPLLDVVFLLLTFFLFAMVVMIRVDLLPMDLEAYAASEPAEPAPALTISVTRGGELFLDRAPVALADLRAAIEAKSGSEGPGRVFIALEAGDGSVDRGPLLTAIWDRLSDAGLDLYLVGQPGD